MKITRIEATPLAIPLAEEFHWAGGAQVGANLVLFTVHTDEGIVVRHLKTPTQCFVGQPRKRVPVGPQGLPGSGRERALCEHVEAGER